MIFAAIDIGSNAVRLLIANAYEKSGNVKVEKATLVRIPIRLGKDVYKNNMISEKRANNLLKTLSAFKLLIDVYQPVGFAACATAAMREATNGTKVLEKIKKQTGLKIKLINGLEEAELIRSTTGFDLLPGHEKVMFIDLGGGSTEISLLTGKHVIDARSFKIGTLRLLNHKVDKSEWDQMGKWLRRFSGDIDRISLIGSGGNINKLAKIFGNPLEGTITLNQLEDAYNKMRILSLKERMAEFGLRPDRADVIVPAAKVFLFIFKKLNANSIMAPKIGLADGIIHQLYLNTKKKSSTK
jgi:exopolyphosphatase/guanosine-5'-triphosphate,3'-diphosphate pyrophosphatase